MTLEEFDAAIREAVAELPEAIREKLANTVFAVQERSTRRHRGLLGLYEGVPFPERGQGEPASIDRITLFKGAIEREAESKEDTVRVIRETILHEVGHFLGLDDEELDRMGLG